MPETLGFGRDALCALWEPDRGFQRLADRGPSRPAFWLLMVYLLISTAVSIQTIESPNTGVVIVFGFLGLAIVELILIALVWVFAAAVRARLKFSEIVIVLAVANLPFFPDMAIEALSRDHFALHQISRVVSAASTLWFCALAFIGIRVFQASHPWRAAAAGLPVTVTALGILIYALDLPPPTAGSALPWQLRAGQFINLHLPAYSQVKEPVAAQADRLLITVCETLRTKPPDWKIDVYLFGDGWQHGAYVGERPEDYSAYTHGRYITAVLDDWENLEPAIAHEFAHVILNETAGESTPALLAEGLATYVEEELFAPSDERSRGPTSRESLSALAVSDKFYDLKDGKYGDRTGEHYGHAAAFVRFLIDEHGLARFMEYCRRASSPWSWDESLAMEEAANRVYGCSLTNLEERWRSRLASPGSESPDSRYRSRN